MNEVAVEETPTTTASPGSSSELPALFRHSARPQWGLAIVAWEHEGRRGYQFEDGELRIFKEGFFHLLEEVTKPLDQAAATTARLSRAAGLAADGSKPPPTEAPKAPVETVPFERQVAYFLRLFPEGFNDPQWKAMVRGDSKRRAKKHRDAAIADAGEKLSRERLDALLEADDLRGVADLAGDVLGATNLTTGAQGRPVTEMTRGREKLFAPALRDLLWDENEPLANRMERFIATLGKPTWPLVTALPALVHPERHICVHGPTFRSQAAWLAPRMRWSRKPGGRPYTEVLELAGKLRHSLEEAGAAPNDMFDVYEFVRRTLKPSAIEKIRQLPPQAAGDA
jgi:hypothetical protein